MWFVFSLYVPAPQDSYQHRQTTELVWSQSSFHACCLVVDGVSFIDVYLLTQILVSLPCVWFGASALQVCVAVCVYVCVSACLCVCVWSQILNFVFLSSRTPVRAHGPWRSSFQATGRKSGNPLMMRFKQGKVRFLCCYVETCLMQGLIAL